MRKKAVIIGGGILILISLIIINFLPPKPTPILLDGPTMSGPVFKKDGELSIISHTTNDTIQTIEIEIADTEASITTGLMYRQEMPIQAGMLFKFETMEYRSFWMKNTLIPLDILFIDDFHKIITIQANTTPKSTKPVPSNGPAKYVLELNAGYCEKFGVKEGDFVVF